MEYVCNNNGGLPGPQIGGWYSCYKNIGESTMHRFDAPIHVINITVSQGNLREAEDIKTEEFY
jgi:hypothetical protein